MTLKSNLTSDVRRPIIASSFDTTSASKGLTPQNRRLAIVAAMTSAGSATANTPVQVSDEQDAIEKFGEGSEAHLMVLWALKTFAAVIAQHGGAASQIWVCPVADPAGTANVKRFAIGGTTASESKDMIVRIAGRTIRAAITSGDAPAAAATKLQAAIEEVDQDLPITAAVATSVNVDCTARVTGVNGDAAPIEVVQVPNGLTVTPSETVAGVGTPTLTTALANLLSKHYQALAISAFASADVTALATHTDAAWANTAKKFRHAFVGLNGTVSAATTLAATNREAICFHEIEGCPNTPGEIAVALAAMSLTVERPAHNYAKTVLPLYAPSDSDAFTDAEVETCLAGGVTPSTVNDAGEVVMERWVTSRTSNGGSVFESLLAGINSKTLYYYALQAEAKAAEVIKGASADADLLELIHDIVFVEVLKAGEDAGDLHNVDAHEAELRVEAHPDLPHRILVEVPQSVVQEALQVDFTHRLHIEAPGAA